MTTTPIPKVPAQLDRNNLIFDDGEPLETNRHRLAMNVLIDSYHRFRGEVGDYFTGGNMFIYYNEYALRNKDFRGPDFFVVLNVDGHKSRQGWVVWEEEGRYPDVIVEFLSASTEAVDRGEKKDLYAEVFKTRNYFIYDPFAPEKFRGWELDEDLQYQALVPDERGWLWSSVLGLWLGSWEGEVLREPATWLRFYDPAGNLVLLPTEEALAERQRLEVERQRAELAEQRAALLAARLRELGIELS